MELAAKGLLEAIEGLVKSTYIMLPLPTKPRRQLRINFLTKITVKKGIMDIYLM